MHHPFAWRGVQAAAALITAGIMLAACQSTPTPPPGPTTIPSSTATPSPSASPTLPPAPVPTLAPIVTATGIALGATDAPVVAPPTQQPTPAPYCYVAKQGDSMVGFISRSGYADLSVWQEVCSLNDLPPNCSDIQVGKQYCVPRQTWTPTPPGYDLTLTARAPIITRIASAISSTAIYIVVENDNITSVVIKTGASLAQICALNNPDPVNCAGCNLEKPVGQWGCAPRLRIGAQIKYPGPPPTPTATLPLTGSETITPTPPYSAPALVKPVPNSTVSGVAQLVWLPSGILQPGEEYLVLVTDVTTGISREFDSQATSIRLPDDMQPGGGQTHTVNWRVAVARKGGDGRYVTISDLSIIYTFKWQGS